MTEVPSNVETRRRRRPLNVDVPHVMWAFKSPGVVNRVEVQDPILADGRRRFPTRPDESSIQDGEDGQGQQEVKRDTRS